jgi:2-haloacid dehalogenase
VGRWATFDCYGTLVDWETGIGDELARLFGEERRDALLGRFHEIEPELQRDGELSYREVLAEALVKLAREEGATLPAGEEDALARSLPSWRVFPEVGDALSEARGRGWHLAILSNTDPGLIAASIEAIGAPFDEVVAASAIGSYKPAPGHWRVFAARTKARPEWHVHVGASLFHDVRPASELGLATVWINRLGERGEPQPTRELPDLTGLPDVLDELVPA